MTEGRGQIKPDASRRIGVLATSSPLHTHIHREREQGRRREGDNEIKRGKKQISQNVISPWLNLGQRHMNIYLSIMYFSMFELFQHLPNNNRK